MSNETGSGNDGDKFDQARRNFLRGIGMGTAAAVAQPAWGGQTFQDTFADFFQKDYRRMSAEEIEAALERIERKAQARYDVEIECQNTPPQPGVVYGYAINISRCKGYRDCVHACVKENNLGRDSQMQYIRVLELDQGDFNLEHSDHYYEPETVPVEGKHYLPVQCMQCDDPPCVKACPVEATWMEPDGIVVVDYDWCIGCRYCMAACPYWARHFNWTVPEIPAEEMNTNTHYLGNRPRPRGVVEKCHFCIHRTRKGQQPACMEACPTGSRIFGNLLDPDSEIRYVLANKQVFRLKEDLGTEPKFWYYSD
ncbi:MAG: 4Fe-4S dicluster domain-containing protein [Gammaproteobacteria bacterium]|nr:4Fe-4S dicluster domain-containing protein [Gammaproteobacteria bacterium]MDH3372055.1 4Fe-4S dicluster domain-containing protein [Gammaproteobacteria bacterium]MDH3407852.1 4Fe-4S dicluster domain-containing protein [Gammaproteobacteria bacterium]MDH3552848.1 4Fe-4S dicluster domain-containing protein [Gammaproteobacteria bacterium]